MLDSLSLADAAAADITLLSATRRVQRVTGLQGMAQPREIVRPKPDRHGDIIDTKHLSGKTTTIEGQLTGANEAAVWTEFDTIQKTLFAAVDTDRTLKWRRATSGTLLQAQVRLAGMFEGPLQSENGGNVLPYQIQLRRSDPRAFTQTQTTATGAALSAAAGGLTIPFTFPFTFTPSGGGVASVNNTGTVPTPPIFRLYGACSSPQVLIVGTGKRIVLTGSVAAGDYLEVDVAERTVKLNGTTNRTNLLDFTATDWSELATGSDTVRLLAATFDANARVDVLYRMAYG